mgnify:CR=1 FL=1|jgi:signal peptidase complex subunit 1
MDYKGQKLAEMLFQIIIALFGFVGFVWGYYVQDFSYCFRCWLVGLIIAAVLTIPDWGMFNQNTPKWLDSIPDGVWTTRGEEKAGEKMELPKMIRGKNRNVSRRSAAKAKDKKKNNM